MKPMDKIGHDTTIGHDTGIGPGKIEKLHK